MRTLEDRINTNISDFLCSETIECFYNITYTQLADAVSYYRNNKEFIISDFIAFLDSGSDELMFNEFYSLDKCFILDCILSKSDDYRAIYEDSTRTHLAK